MNTDRSPKSQRPEAAPAQLLDDPPADPREALRGAAAGYLAVMQQLDGGPSDWPLAAAARGLRCVCWLAAITDDVDAKHDLERKLVIRGLVMVALVREAQAFGARADATALEAGMQAAMLRVDARKSPGQYPELVKRAYEAVWDHLHMPDDLDAATVVACFEGAVEVMHFLVTASPGTLEAYADTARHYLTAEVWPRVTKALAELRVEDAFDQYALTMGALAYLRAARMAERKLSLDELGVIDQALRQLPRNVARRVLVELLDLEVAANMHALQGAGPPE